MNEAHEHFLLQDSIVNLTEKQTKSKTLKMS